MVIRRLVGLAAIVGVMVGCNAILGNEDGDPATASDDETPAPNNVLVGADGGAFTPTKPRDASIDAETSSPPDASAKKDSGGKTPPSTPTSAPTSTPTATPTATPTSTPTSNPPPPPPSCAATKTLCGGDCVDVLTDDKHCGACDKKCKGNETCTMGVCLARPGNGNGGGNGNSGGNGNGNSGGN